MGPSWGQLDPCWWDFGYQDQISEGFFGLCPPCASSADGVLCALKSALYQRDPNLDFSFDSILFDLILYDFTKYKK